MKNSVSIFSFYEKKIISQRSILLFLNIFIISNIYPLNASETTNYGIIYNNKEEGTYLNLIPIEKKFPRSDIKFGDWVLGQYSGIKDTDFFLYDSILHTHPLRISSKDEIIMSHEYENINLGDAYDKLPSPLNIQIGYGRNISSSGTAIGVQSTLDIFNETTPHHGRNEFSAYYAYVRSNNRGKHPPGQHYWVSDFHLSTPYAPEASKSPELEVVYSGRIMNLSNGVSALSNSHMGSYAQSLVATPMLKNELSSAGVPLEARTYPITAMISLSGFSGDQSTYTGTLPSARPAADYALRIGGGGGSPYIPFDSRSNFTTGIGVYDWAKTGIDIDHRLPGATGPGLKNRYATELGGNMPLAGQPYSLILHDEHPDPSAPGKAGIQIGDTPHAWLLAATQLGSIQQTLEITLQSEDKPVMAVSAHGIGFFGRQPITPPKLHPNFDVSKKIDPQELAKAYNSLHDALVSIGLAQ
ncbi:hypothetical protein [Gluconobacter cerinus]|uniref:hypothetical protein n=1 Tax=Gluconobacter cerinus TaxID=38307 RepID=UPI003AB23F97